MRLQHCFFPPQNDIFCPDNYVIKNDWMNKKMSIIFMSYL